MGPTIEHLARIDEAVDSIRKRWAGRPVAGIVLGTGSGQIADELQVEVRLPYSDIPHFPRSTALGHKGSLVCGCLGLIPVVAMQGRFHLYEGYSVDATTLPIHVMQRLGIERLLISNAAGGVNPAYSVGELMLIESHIDFFNRTSRHFQASDSEQNIRPAFRADAACSQELIAIGQMVSRANQFVLHRGVYVGLLGPTYETRAEYRMVRQIGGDVVGMSTIPEITVASFYGLPTLAVSIITNVAKPGQLVPTTGHAVVAAAELAAKNLRAIFVAAVQGLQN